MAAPVLTAPQVNDLVAMTLRHLGKPNFTEISTDLQEHFALPNLYRKDRVEIYSGYGVQWDVMVDHLGSAVNQGILGQDVVNDRDTMVQAQADWRFTTCNYPLSMPIVDMNREPQRIVNYVKEKRLAALISLTELMESNYFGPPVALADTVTPWGLKTWVVKNGTQGFTGAAPSGYTVIGLNPTTYPRWKNYADIYTAVSRDDFIRKARRMAYYTKFKPPVAGIPTFNTGDDLNFWTTYSVRASLVESLESQNDNLGNDIAPMDGGEVLFMRRPVKWVPRLEPDTTGPFYSINMGVFKTHILQGWWLRETHVPIYPGEHTKSAHFMDCLYQIVVKDRRRQGVMATSTTEPS